MKILFRIIWSHKVWKCGSLRKVCIVLVLFSIEWWGAVVVIIVVIVVVAVGVMIIWLFARGRA